MRPSLFKALDGPNIRLNLDPQEITDLDELSIGTHRDTFDPTEASRNLSFMTNIAAPPISFLIQTIVDKDPQSPIPSPLPPVDNLLLPTTTQPITARSSYFCSWRQQITSKPRKDHTDSDCGTLQSSLDFDSTLINFHREVAQEISVDEEESDNGISPIQDTWQEGHRERTETVTRSHFFSRFFYGLKSTKRPQRDSTHRSSFKRIQRSFGFRFKDGTHGMEDNAIEESSQDLIDRETKTNNGRSTKKSKAETPSYDIALPIKDLSPTSTRSTSALLSFFGKEPVKIRRDSRTEKINFIKLMEQKSARRVKSASYHDHIGSLSVDDSTTCYNPVRQKPNSQHYRPPNLIDTFHALKRQSHASESLSLGSETPRALYDTSGNLNDVQNVESMMIYDLPISFSTRREGSRSFSEPVSVLERKFFDIDFRRKYIFLKAIRQRNERNKNNGMKDTDDKISFQTLDDMFGNFDDMFPDDSPEPIPTLVSNSAIERGFTSEPTTSKKTAQSASSISSLSRSLRVLFRVRRRTVS